MPDDLVERIAAHLTDRFVYYPAIMEHFGDVPDRWVVQAMARLSREERLERDREGRYRLKASTPQADPSTIATST